MGDRRFKPGDRVILHNGDAGGLDEVFIGEVGTVQEGGNRNTYHVKMDRHIRLANSTNTYLVHEEHMLHHLPPFDTANINTVEEFLNG